MIRCTALVALVLAHGAALGADSSIATYTATYAVQYKGKAAGTAEFAVRYLEREDAYEFTSRTMAKGLLKLARPNPVVERSRFRVVGATLQPLEFWYEDGSRSGEDNFHVVFDWQRRVATISTAAARRELAVPEAALDRGTLQVALMRDLERAGQPATYELADEDSVAHYAYTDNGAARLETEAGSHETRVLTQQRTGSSRSTWLWVAPALRFLPVRIEQRRDGETQTALELVSVTGLAARP